MKKNTLFLLLAISSYTISAQVYDTEKLKITAKIWGECFLFHPSVVRADKDVNWEKQLLEFLPSIKQVSSADSFIENLNSGLLSALQDPYTAVQAYRIQKGKATIDIANSKLFDYIKLSEDRLSDIGSLEYFDSIIGDKASTLPLVLDCRISEQLLIDWHTYTPFHYLVSMLIDKEISLSQSISREHFGWDEYNDWWFYEQRWKIAQEDKQQEYNGILMPLSAYQQNLQQKLTNFNFERYSSIKRPLYFIMNKSFLSYYHSLLQSLQAYRSNTFMIFENAGEIFSGHQGLKKYQFRDFEFVLNSSFFYNPASTDLHFGLVSPVVSSQDITDFVQSNPKQTIPGHQFSFQISPEKYESAGKELSLEEKILGIIKTWTIVKYFYPYLEDCPVDWDGDLETFLKLAQKTRSDKEYYYLIQEMMASLNDSHVSTYHPSILDFSEIFVAPLQFEWIENKAIVTAIDSSVNADIHIGNEIVAINNTTIDDILKKEAKTISSSNRQGLLATVINPGYFTGPSGSLVKFSIKNKGEEKTVDIPRTMYVFQFMGFGDHRQASTTFDSTIGYLNLAMLTNTAELESELLKMKNTNSLIIDLRNSYPTSDYQRFLQMLCESPVTSRRSEVPVISASQAKVWHYEVNKVYPNSSLSYNKPIAVLIDKTMISRPEDIAIALKSFPNVRFIGEQTQGTDGELTKIYLPGGGVTSFTGQIVKFGNGEMFQGTGIMPDIKVERTIHGLKNNEDEILEKAIDILKNN